MAALATPDGTPLFDVLLVSPERGTLVDVFIFLVLYTNAIRSGFLLLSLVVEHFWGDKSDIKVVETRVKTLETKLEVIVEIFAKHTTNIGRLFDPKVDP